MKRTRPRWLPRLHRHPVVPVVRLRGAIGSIGPRSGLNLAVLDAPLKRAFGQRGARAVALAINSPGGSPVQSALIAQRIRDLATEKNLPVLAFIEDVGASGGYWLACAGDEIYAASASIVGSIGVVSAGFGFVDALQRLGIERRVYTSGARKALLDPFRPEDEEDVARLRAIQSDIHEQFKQLVRERRGDKLRAPEDELFDGRIWTGRGALGTGLIDGLGTLHAVVRERFGSKVKLRTVNPARSRLPWPLRAVPSAASLCDHLLDRLEERLLFARFGL